MEKLQIAIEIIVKNKFDIENASQYLSDNTIEFINAASSEQLHSIISEIDRKSVAALVMIMEFYIPFFKPDAELFKVYLNFLKKVCQPDLYRLLFGFFENLISSSFHSIWIKFPERYRQVAETLKAIMLDFDAETFSVCQGILTFLSYKLEKPELIATFKSSYKVKIQSKDYNTFYNYVLMNYYRGVIFIAEKNFESAAISFLLAVKTEVSAFSSVFTLHQLEAYKRLTILAGIVSNDMSSIIRNAIISNETPFMLPTLTIYAQLKNIHIEKIANLDAYGFFFLQNREALSKDNLIVRLNYNYRGFTKFY